MNFKTMYSLPLANKRYYVQRAGKEWRARRFGFAPARETDIYVSSSAWLDPCAAFRASNTWKHSRYVLLRQDLVLDFDTRGMGQVFRALDVLGALGHTRFLLVETSRGRHLWDFSFGDTLKMREDPYARANHAAWEQYRILNILLDNGVKLDFNASLGCKRVFRVPFSYHRAGVQCTARAITLDKQTTQPEGARGASL